MAGRIRVNRLIRLVMVASAALAISSPALATLSQGFASTGTVTAGSLVSLDKSGAAVIPADATNSDRLFGVAVPDSSAQISLGSSTAGQVQVVTTGGAEALVSTEGGKIKVGDYISLSSVAGVGEKVPSGSHRVIGTAQADFDGTGTDVTKREIKDGSGGKHEITLGQIPIQIAVSTYTNNTGNAGYQLPVWLQNFSNDLAGKAVAPVRIVVAGIILIVTLVSITVLLYSAVRNSIISIGRNPLSRASVLRGLLEVIGVVLVLMGVAAGAMYLLIAR